MIRAMEQWFETDFPQILRQVTDVEEILEKVKNNWYGTANVLNLQLTQYVEGTGKRMGLRCCAAHDKNEYLLIETLIIL